MRIGELLIAQGKLTRGQAGEAARLSIETGLLFGQAAVKLGYVSRTDVDEALRQRLAAPASLATSRHDGGGVALVEDPTSLQAEDVRRLAKTLAVRWFAGPTPQQALSIISAERGEGRTTLATNLACAFAIGGAKTLLIDGDFDNPRIHAMLTLGQPSELDEGSPDGVKDGVPHPVEGISNLAVIPATGMARAESDQLLRFSFGHIIQAHAKHFDAVIVDTAAASASNDYLLAGQATRGAIVVGRQGRMRTRTSVRMLNACDDAGVTIVGGTMIVE